MTTPATPRTTPSLVAGLVAVEDGADVAPFIATATEIVTSVCSASGYTDGFLGSRMELIERWLAAHLYTIFDNQLSMAKAGTVAVSYQYKVDFGLKNSMYGQQVMLLDTAGSLAKFANSLMSQRKIKVGIAFLGKRCQESLWPSWWFSITEVP